MNQQNERRDWEMIETLSSSAGAAGPCVQQLPLPALDSERTRIRCPHWAQTSITRVIRFYFSNKQDFIALGVIVLCAPTCKS